ncbi:MAG: hypothetical protein L0216_14085 [Planctomycetales bacterium]|nr:hypothetical protein [Planctomycetales bacterium]
MRRGVRAGLLLVPIVAALAAPARADEFDYRFGKGEVLRYTVRRHLRVSYKGDAAKITETDLTDNTLDLEPTEERATDGALAARFREMKLVRTTAEFSIQFDSRSPPGERAVAEAPGLGMLSGIIGDGFNLSVDPRGRVGAWGFPDLLTRGAWRGLGAELGAAVAQGTEVRQVLSDASATVSYSTLFVPFPDPVPSGGEWTATVTTVDGDIGHVLEFKYRIVSVSGPVASLAIGGAYKLTYRGQPVPKEGPIRGSASFDTRAGRLLSCSHESSIKLPNVSLSSSADLRFVKAVPAEEAGPESFETPLKAGVALLGRRRAPGRRDQPTRIRADESCRVTAFHACGGDLLRVLERREAPEGARLRVVSARGRAGWVPEAETEPAPPPRAGGGRAGRALETCVFVPSFQVDGRTLRAGHAFALAPADGRALIVTCIHLFTRAAGLAQDIPAEELPTRVTNYSLLDPASDALLAEGGPPLLIAAARPMFPMEGAMVCAMDLAAFPAPEGVKLKLLKLAERTPEPGETVTVLCRAADKPREGAKPRRATVTSVTASQLAYVFEEPLPLQALSGAPVLDSSGDVVGMNLGGRTDEQGKVHGVGNPAAGIRRLLGTAKKGS